HLDAEARSLSRTRCQRDRVIEQAAEAVDDREPEAETAAPVAIGIRNLVELVEDVLLVILGNTRAGVPHFDPKPLAAPPATDQDASARGVADSIGHEIEHDALEQQAVAAHPRLRRDDPQRQSLVPRRLRERPLDLAEQIRDREIADLGCENAGV